MDNLDRFYKILDLESGASEDKVKEAWRTMVKVWHPDRFFGDPKLQSKAQEKLKEINEAYDTLRSKVSTQKPRKHPKTSSSKPQKSKDLWVTDLRDGEVVSIVDLHCDDSYFNQRNRLVGVVIKVWGDLTHQGDGWYCLRALCNDLKVGKVIYFSFVRVKRLTY